MLLMVVWRDLGSGNLQSKDLVDYHTTLEGPFVLELGLLNFPLLPVKPTCHCTSAVSMSFPTHFST